MAHNLHLRTRGDRSMEYEDQEAAERKSQLYKELQKLSQLSDDARDMLIHDVADKLCGRGASGSSDLDTLAAACATFLTDQIGHPSQTFDPKEVAGTLKSNGVPDAATRSLVLASMTRRAEIEKALRDNTSKISPWTLQDFDWSIRLVMGSALMNTLRTPLLLLTLTLTAIGGQTRSVCVELTKDQLDKLLEQCEQLNAVLGRLRA